MVLKLHESNHQPVCCVRDLNKIPNEIQYKESIEYIKVDFLEDNLEHFPKDIGVAYYLIHSMTATSGNFEELERKCTHNFKKLIERTNCKQVIYLSGIVNDKSLSKHLQSRLHIEQN